MKSFALNGLPSNHLQHPSTLRPERNNHHISRQLRSVAQHAPPTSLNHCRDAHQPIKSAIWTLRNKSKREYSLQRSRATSSKSPHRTRGSLPERYQEGFISLTLLLMLKLGELKLRRQCQRFTPRGPAPLPPRVHIPDRDKSPRILVQ